MSKQPNKKTPLPKWAKIMMKISRILLVPVLCFIAIVGGMIIGYAYIGDGAMSEVFQRSTWQHLFDLIFKDS